MPAPDIPELLKRTIDAAAAFVDDMQLIRTVAKEGHPGPSQGEMRRVSAILRRLIVEDDLQRIANPRIGRIKLSAADTKSIIALKPDVHLTIGNKGSALTAFPAHRGIVEEMKDAKKTRLLVNVDSFRVQPVLCLDGLWVRRLAVIKFVANTLSGVHSQSLSSSDEDRALARARVSLVRTVNADGSTNVRLNHALTTGVVGIPTYDPSALDPVLLELVFTAELLVESEDVSRLEEVIKKEIGR